MVEVDIWNNQLEEAEAHAAYQAVLDRCVSDGRIVKQMEEKISELLEIPYTVATPSGSSALLLALMAAGVQPGDEVIYRNGQCSESVGSYSCDCGYRRECACDSGRKRYETDYRKDQGCHSGSH